MDFNKRSCDKNFRKFVICYLSANKIIKLGGKEQMGNLSKNKTIKGCFSYREEIPQEVLGIIDLDTDYSKDVIYEVVVAGCNSRLDYSREFRQGAYATTIYKRNEMRKSKYYAKHSRICNSSDEDSLEAGCVAIDTILADTTAYDSVETQDEVSTETMEFLSMISFYKEEKGIDLKKLVASAIQGVGGAVSQLRYIMADDKALAETVQTLLSNNAMSSIVLQ